jgi:hypothetical protein
MSTGDGLTRKLSARPPAQIAEYGCHPSRRTVRAIRIRRSNLTFDNDHLVVTAMVQNQKIAATVDTGAINTDLYTPFADKFDNLLKQYGKRDPTERGGYGRSFNAAA